MPRFVVQLVAVAVVAGVSIVLAGEPSGIGEIASALGDSETEIRSGVFPAVVGVLTAILVIGIAAGVVRVISRNN